MSLFKACNINIRCSYVVYSLPMVSAEDKENDIQYLQNFLKIEKLPTDGNI